MVGLERADRLLRRELTDTLVAIRVLDRAARQGTLSREDAARLLSLRSRGSRLHKELAAGNTALRELRNSAPIAAVLATPAGAE